MKKELDRFNETVSGRDISVVGLGISNLPLIKMLCEAGAHVTVRDMACADKLEKNISALKDYKISYILGRDYLKEIRDSIIFRTPGLRFDEPELLEAVRKGSRLTSEMELFFELCPAYIIGVTGSAGKTTTTTLISEILRKAGKKTYIGGNIGTPLLPKIGEMDEDSFAVVELSSFQLHTMEKSPDTAVITNISPNHLDKHKSYEEYIEAKKNIFLYQQRGDRLILNYGCGITKGFSAEAKGEVIPFSLSGNETAGSYCKDGTVFFKDMPVMRTDDILLPGDHNTENYMAAAAAVFPFVNVSDIKAVARSFTGVKHRMELVRTLDGVRYYNDSIATSPDRTLAGLKAFDSRVILIAGGYDKNLDYTEFGLELPKYVKALILTGATAEKIKKAVNKNEHNVEIIETDDFDKTVEIAHSVASDGDIVLLSPVSASFDMFRNFEERGDRFRSLVEKLDN